MDAPGIVKSVIVPGGPTGPTIVEPCGPCGPAGPSGPRKHEQSSRSLFASLISVSWLAFI